MSAYAKILSFSYDSAAASKASALKTYWRSVRLFKDAGKVNPGKDSTVTNILLNGNCIDAENRNLYLFYIDTYFGSSWIIEVNIDTRNQTVVYYDKYNTIGFNPLFKIYNAKVVHGRLIWTDNNMPIYQMDIVRAKRSFYHKIGYGQYPDTAEWNSLRPYEVDEVVSNGNYFYKAKIGSFNVEPKTDNGTNWQLLCLIEDAYYSMKVENFYFEAMPPKHPPVLTYQSDESRKINNLRQTLFQCAYRYVYIDWRKSTFSPASIVPVPQQEETTASGLASEQISLNNKIQISVNLGGEEVRAVEIIGRSSQDPSKWFLIDTINKFEEEERGSQVSKLTIASFVPMSITVPAPSVRNLSAPPAPVATAGTNLLSTGFTANWNASAGASGYYLDVATDSAFTNYVSGYHNRDIGNVTSFIIRGLASNMTYYYRLRAYNNHSLISYNSNTITVIIVIDAPVALEPSNVFGTGFTANWAAVAGATGYRLDVSEAGDFSSFIAGYNNLDVANVLTYNIVGLSVQTTYYYRLRAYNALGTSVNSNRIDIRTDNPPDAPVATAATAIALSSFSANWGAATGATGYYLDVATDAGFSSLISGYNNRFVGNVLTFLVIGLTPNTTYYYRVRGVDGHNINGAYSNVISLLTLLTPPVAVAASSIYGTGFTANWGSVAGATGYRLDVATDSAFTSMIAGYNNRDVANVLTFGITGLTLNTPYFYRVRAYTAIQTSASSNTVSQRTSTPPASVIALAATNIGLNSFTANWEAASGAAGYTLDVATDSGFLNMISGFNVRNVGNVLTFPVLGLSSNTSYYYRIRAYDLHGINGSYSNTISVKTLLEAPIAREANNVFATGFTANWDAAPGATGYYLDIATDAAFTAIVSGFNGLNVGSVSSYNVTGLSVNTTYYYRLRAYNEIGPSAYSNIVSQRTSAAPSDVVATAGTNVLSTGFTSNWNASTGAAGYYLDVATDNGFVNKVSGYDGRDVGNVLSYLVRGLASNTNYYYRLRAYDNHGLLSNYSNTITVLTLPPLAPDPPLATAATNVLYNSMTANWNASAGATGYLLDVSRSITFSTFLPGFNGLDVGNVLSYVINGLNGADGYYYRVRAYSSTGTSGASNIISQVTPAAPAPTISLNPSVWNFGGININKVITVSISNADTWGINFPSLNGRIHLYDINIAAGTATLYYSGTFGTGDTVQFYATGVGGTVYATFTGRWT